MIVVECPSNDFGRQEPGENHQIQAFCRATYGVKFPMAAKLKIQGDDAHPLYQWLTSKAKNGYLDTTVKWNFQKYLLDEQGHIVTTLASSVEPLSEPILDWLASSVFCLIVLPKYFLTMF